MFGDTLLVLMWKHFRVRTRRFIYTFAELSSTVVLLLVLFLFRKEINPSPPKALFENAMQVQHTVPLSVEKALAPQRLLYTPRTEFTDQIMDIVGYKLRLKRLDSISGEGRRGFYGITPDTSPDDVSQNVYDEAIVVFKDMNNTTPPKKLWYNIRMRENFLTHIFDSLDEVSRPHERFGTIYETFMRLQWAIDTTFIQLLTNTAIPQNLSMQEFPYPEQELAGASGTSIVCILAKFMCVISLMLVFVLLMSRLLEERTSGIQQLIKMVGVSHTTLSVSHFLNVLPSGLVFSIVGTVLLKVSATPLVANTCGLYVWLLLLLHFASVAAMAFACSYIVNSTNYGVSMSFLAFTLLWLPTRLADGKVKQQALVMALGLAPHMPVYWFWGAVGQAEARGTGVSLTTRDKYSGNVLEAYLFLVLQTIIFSFLAWYLEQVRPGRHGAPQPWNFLFQKQYWYPQKVTPHSADSEEETLAHDAKYFEQPPKDMDVGVKIVNVSKEFGEWGRAKTRALSQVSLDIYRGEVTVLLGHNGAGKTTLMSIITGMLQATEGDVYVNGLHSVQQRRQLHRHLGLCPQHNLFFADLTVLEHVMFFTMLKGVSFKKARESSLKLLDRVGIADKADSSSMELSGGMKRRLQLSCALAGDADVLVLDEPTSGLDVETRRELWDLLLSLRGSRTVVLTTHFMEEADALGDRVAALHGGRVRCHATPMYLKKAIGSGYRLTLTTSGMPDTGALTDAVTAVVPDASLRESSVNSASYTLPARACAQYPQLFDELENHKQELHIESIGVGITTLEEVFLELCKDVDTSMAEDELDSALTEPTYNKITGCALWLRQFCVLFQRQIKHTMYKQFVFLFFQVLVPIVMIVMFTRSFNNEVAGSARTNQSRLDLDLYRDMYEPRVLYNVNSTPAVDWDAMRRLYPHVQFERSNDIYNDIIKAGRKSIHEYNKYLLGIELNDTDAKVHYTTVVRHTAPTALNLLSNVLSMLYVPYGAGDTVVAVIEPLAATFQLNQLVAKEPKDFDKLLSWSLFIVFVTLATLLNAVSLPCKERENCSRHIHIMSGCPAPLYWAVTFLYHELVFCLTLLPAVLISAVLLDTDGTMGHAPLVVTLALALLVGAGAFLALTFLLSFAMNERMCAIALVVCVFVFGFITPAVTAAKDMIQDTASDVYSALMTIPLVLMPPHTLALAVLRAADTARLNAYCSLNFEKCPNLVVPDLSFDAEACCASPSHQPYSYAAMQENRPAPLMLILLAQLIGYMSLVLLCQYGVLNGLWDRACNGWLRRYTPRDAPPADDLARKEASYVRAAIALPKDKIEDAMLVHDLHKNYYKLFRGSCHAVQGISFSVKKGECFGLLGVNGAGKSTTFKMLTGEERPSRGRIYASGQFLDRSKVQYMWNLGYCPQFFGLDGFLTGRENLQLLLTMRGLDATDVAAQCKAWLHVVGLEKYAGRAVVGYSGGCVRRLAAACGLAAGAPLALLDEPTCGVDTAARRRVWRALRKGLKDDRAIIITSHSMDEMSALCNRIAILHRGVVRAIGSVNELRAAHTTGHAAQFKLKDRDGIGAAEEVNKLKAYMMEHFNCTLKDEHKTMLHYHINETLPYSELFSRMEKLKERFPFIEDYSVTETTLEEVFLTLAKEAPPGDVANV